MSYYVYEDSEGTDILRTFMYYDLSHDRIKDLIWLLGLGAYETAFAPMSATKMVLVHSKVDYTFSSKDLDWLSFSSKAFWGTLPSGANVFSINMICSPEDYYVPCAAIVKIFNIAFPGHNFFVFKLNRRVAFGCKRSFSDTCTNNFCISALFDQDTIEDMETLIEELFYAPSITDYPLVLLDFSPQESVRNKSLDQRRFNPDYLLFLDEFQSIHGVDVSSEKEHYLASFSAMENRTEHRAVSYKDACNILSDIADREESSSLDVLDAAIVAEEKAIHQKQILPSAQLFDEILTENQSDFSVEAYLNAEVMLNEMLKRNNEQ